MSMEDVNAPGEPPHPGMKWIPGGSYQMGSERHYPEEKPAGPVSVDGFWKDGVRYTPYMAGAGAEFRASLNRTVLAGHDLEGGALRILTPEGAYQLMFVRVTPTIESSAPRTGK